MTRAEHLQWCKDRALEYVEMGDHSQAVASMMSDLGKHPETAGSREVGMFIALTIKNASDARRFVEGFN
jgi:hypothetical protein